MEVVYQQVCKCCSKEPDVVKNWITHAYAVIRSTVKVNRLDRCIFVWSCLWCNQLLLVKYRDWKFSEQTVLSVKIMIWYFVK